MLPEGDERELLRRVRDEDDSDALSALIASHLRLAWSVARRHARFGMSIEDLVSEGVIGLLEAARRFDPARGARFATYARLWVNARIRHFAAQNRHAVGLPSTRAARRIIGRLHVAERRLVGELGRAPSTSEIAAALGETAEDVSAVLVALRSLDVSLDGPLGVVLAVEAPSPEELASSREASEINRRALRDAMHVLDDRERFILQRRMDPGRHTLEAVGNILDLSRDAFVGSRPARARSSARRSSTGSRSSATPPVRSSAWRRSQARAPAQAWNTRPSEPLFASEPRSVISHRPARGTTRGA